MAVSITVPREAAKALDILRESLGDGLLAVYLHGSAVAGGLRPHSDVDVLAVVEPAPTPGQRRALVERLLRISAYPAREGGPRPVEVIVCRRADLRAAAYPPRAEFIYGEWLRDRYEAGGIPRAECDPELAPVLAWARQTGVALYGPPAAELLPVVPMAVVRRAMGDALPALLASMDGDERNVLLTLARMWHTSSTGAIVPKDVAAQWAMERLPADAAREVGLARADYLGLVSSVASASSVPSVPSDPSACAPVDWSRRGSTARRAAQCLAERVEPLLR